ncbi:Cytochrome c oxidase subunit 2 precursor [Marinomonas aquimarina]|uniref:Cytochrome c oxidase subunit 2 n=1 Tax=Marinomonas aquimarina TaxID=295068 RepID=A0A1A8TSP7_9GAMM|nr:cytochrome c oxidase subunit II [Marinomonas aquimarina]SBS36328.1 Cytochrome c oxidase subunit 2 precursor [Marinomonas aquimarina]
MLKKGQLVILGGTLLYPVTLFAEWEVNMEAGVTAVSRSIYALHMQIFWICVAIAVVVFGVMFWSIFRYRKSAGAKAKQFHENTLVELAWTIVPVLILVAMAIPATATLTDMYNTDDSEIDVQITGYQWKWQYQYLGEEVSFFSNLSTPMEQISNQQAKGEHYLLEVDEPLVLPVGKKVRFLLTSNDVIHSWWVPALAVKKDAIPGFINETWVNIEEEGIYRGQCTELCGKNHGFMPVVVQAVSEQEFQGWLQDKREAIAAERAAAERVWTMEELYQRGEQAYLKNCAACHQAGGQGVPSIFPALKGNSIVRFDMKKHIDIVLHGRSGTAMPAFSAQMGAVDIAAVITYERNAWGNDTGEMISPQEIQALLNEPR